MCNLGVSYWVVKVITWIMRSVLRIDVNLDVGPSMKTDVSHTKDKSVVMRMVFIPKSW